MKHFFKDFQGCGNPVDSRVMIQSALTRTFTCPDNFSISPKSADIREDLPQPTCPTRATNLPSGTCRFMLKARTCVIIQ